MLLYRCMGTIYQMRFFICGMTNVIIQTAVVNMPSCAPPRCIVFNADLTNTNRPQHPRTH